MKEIKAKKEARKLMLVQDFSSREDGGRPIMYGAATDGAELRGEDD